MLYSKNGDNYIPGYEIVTFYYNLLDKSGK